MGQKFLLDVSLDNAAFEDYDAELPRILRHVADRIQEAGRVHCQLSHGKVYDWNGNHCGGFRIVNTRRRKKK